MFHKNAALIINYLYKRIVNYRRWCRYVLVTLAMSTVSVTEVDSEVYGHHIHLKPCPCLAHVSSKRWM